MEASVRRRRQCVGEPRFVLTKGGIRDLRELATQNQLTESERRSLTLVLNQIELDRERAKAAPRAGRRVLDGERFSLPARALAELSGLVAEERLTPHERVSLCLVLDELQTARAQAAA